ncbi:MAG: AAA family ATPase, partial [Symploca sp. SIO3E6]|nr:AAA family ATPase [Caldora sp. SIO3E6]
MTNNQHQPHRALVQELDLMIRARYPLLYIVTVEEVPLEEVLCQVAEYSQPPRKLLLWDVVR